jgi:hypothetical protein
MKTGVLQFTERGNLAIVARRVLLVSTLFVGLGCSPAARRNVGTVMAGAAQSAASVSGSENGTTKVMVFGGLDHKTYLGCLNCSQYTADSIFNEYGQHGSRYASESIWNHYSEFGSAYSSYGACNAYASDPPVIVDSAGRYFGRLTLNTYHGQFGAGANYYSWLKESVCESN